MIQNNKNTFGGDQVVQPQPGGTSPSIQQQSSQSSIQPSQRKSKQQRSGGVVYKPSTNSNNDTQNQLNYDQIQQQNSYGGGLNQRKYSPSLPSNQGIATTVPRLNLNLRNLAEENGIRQINTGRPQQSLILSSTSGRLQSSLGSSPDVHKQNSQATTATAFNHHTQKVIKYQQQTSNDYNDNNNNTCLLPHTTQFSDQQIDQQLLLSQDQKSSTPASQQMRSPAKGGQPIQQSQQLLKQQLSYQNSRDEGIYEVEEVVNSSYQSITNNNNDNSNNNNDDNPNFSQGASLMAGQQRQSLQHPPGLVSMTLPIADGGVNIITSQQQHQQRVPREDRKRRRMLQQAFSNEHAVDQTSNTSSSQIKSLVEQTSRTASMQIESIVNERLNKLSRQSGSRSGRKIKASDQFGISKQTPDDENSVDCNSNDQMVRQSLSSTQHYYKTSSIHQYPKADIDLRNYEQQDQQLKINNSNISYEQQQQLLLFQQQKSATQPITFDIRKNSDIMMESFDQTADHINARSSEIKQTEQQSSPDPLERQMRNESSSSINNNNSNSSFQIRKRSVNNITDSAGVAQNLNQLVQSSVQNLSKILQRPGSTQSRHQVSIMIEEQMIEETPQKDSDDEEIVRHALTPIDEELKHLSQNITPAGNEEKMANRKQRSYTSSFLLDKNISLKKQSIRKGGEKDQNYNNNLAQQKRRKSLEPQPSSNQVQQLRQPQYPKLKKGDQKNAARQWNSHKAVIDLSASKTSSSKTEAAQGLKQMQLATTNSNGTNNYNNNNNNSRIVAVLNLPPPKKDLSIIAESDATSKNGFQSPVESSKKYMQLTAIAAARKDAIIRKKSSVSSSDKLVGLNYNHNLQLQQTSLSHRTSRKKLSITVPISSSQSPSQPVSPDRTFTRQAIKIQRCIRVFLSWKRLNRLSNFRTNLLAAIQGYRVRRMLSLPHAKTLVKEILLLLRREHRQSVIYLREQQRKKIRPLVIQLIGLFRSTTTSVAPAASVKNVVIIQPAKQQNSRTNQQATKTTITPAPSTSVGKKQQSQHNNRNNSGKNSQYHSRQQAQTPLSSGLNSNKTAKKCKKQVTSLKQQSDMNLDLDLITPQHRVLDEPKQVRAQTARPEYNLGLTDLGVATQSSQIIIPKRNLEEKQSSQQRVLHQQKRTSTTSDHINSSTLFKQTKSYQHKISATAAGATKAAQFSMQESQSSQSLQKNGTINSKRQKSEKQNKSTAVANANAINDQKVQKFLNNQIGKRIINNNNNSATVSEQSPKPDQLNAHPYVSSTSSQQQRVLIKQQTKQQLPLVATQNKGKQNFSHAAKAAKALSKNVTMNSNSITANEKERESMISLISTKQDILLDLQKSPSSLQELYMRTSREDKMVGSKTFNKTTPQTKSGAIITREKSTGRIATISDHDSLLKKVISDEKKAGLKRDSAKKQSQICYTLLQGTKPFKQTSQTKQPATGKKDTTKIVSASLNSSFQSQIKSDKNHTTASNYDQQLMTPPLKKLRKKGELKHNKVQKSIDATEMPFSPLSLDEADPSTNLRDINTKTSQDTKEKQISTQKKSSGSKKYQQPPLGAAAARPTTLKLLPTVQAIQNLMHELSNQGSLLNSPTNQKQQQQQQQQLLVKKKPQQTKQTQEQIMAEQARQRLNLERYIIDLRRDFEIACLEQRSNNDLMKD